MLIAISEWLQSPNNEALLLSEDHDDSMKIVAENCVLAGALLKAAAEEVALIEPSEESHITSESIEELAVLADMFDKSGDPGLKKQASVIDELLLSIAAPPNAYAERKDLQDQRLIDLKKKYEEPREVLYKDNKIADVERAIDKSNMTKTYEILAAPLSARTCPVHPGVQIARVGEHMWQCELDKKVYNFETGFETPGGKVPGGSVAEQTDHFNIPYYNVFDSREGRLNSNK